MTRIVTTHYRYKRPPRKRKAVALDVPAIATSISRKRARFLAEPAAGDDTDEAVTVRFRAAIAKLRK